jgi:hypothetical protein
MPLAIANIGTPLGQAQDGAGRLIPFTGGDVHLFRRLNGRQEQVEQALHGGRSPARRGIV